MDLKVIETGNGGDLVLLGNDLVQINGFQNMPYLGLFGGNVEASTQGPKIPDQQAFDWWGNNLFMPNQSKIQLNSYFERALIEIPLSSRGRLLLEQAAKRSLAFMESFSGLSVSASITGPDRIELIVKIQEPNNKQSTELVFIWDGTKSELTQITE
jgi:phage gp46-like protein